MRGASTLIPARFLTLVGHLCVLVTLLWESQQSVQHCLPAQHHEGYIQIYHSRLVAGLGAAIAFIVIELTTFILGLTMFSPSVSLISIAAHGSAAILLSYFVLDGWLCAWYWPIFALCSVLPAVADLATAVTENQRLTKSPHEYKPGWSFYLVLAGVATTLGSSLPVGFNIGVVNTPADLIKSFCNESIIAHYDVVLSKSWLDVLWSAVVSVFIVGGCTGSILGATLADHLGRKKATIAISGLSVSGAVLFACCRAANSVEMLLAGRLLVGLAGGLTTSIVPMYLTELAPPRLTGALGVACPMGVNVGVLVGQLMGLEYLLGGVDDWPYLLSVYVLLVILCLPLLFILPESPKYLYVIRRNEEEALKELSRLRGASTSVLSEDIELLGEESSASCARADNWSMLRVARDPRLRLPLLLVCSMQAGQQTSGINAVFYYSQTIFKQAGLSEQSAQYATIGCGFVNVCTAVLMLYLLPRVGRRPLLLGSVLAATLLLAALAAAMTFIRLWIRAKRQEMYASIGCGFVNACTAVLMLYPLLHYVLAAMLHLAALAAAMTFIAVVSWMPYVCMAAVLGYVLVYGLGLGPIPYFIASEMLEVGPRPAGMAWGSLANWAGNCAVGMAFPSLRAALGPYSFLLFSAVTCALFVFQKMYFPETRGKTPAQVTAACARAPPHTDRWRATLQ